jgi:hypothetical protein
VPDDKDDSRTGARRQEPLLYQLSYVNREGPPQIGAAPVVRRLSTTVELNSLLNERLRAEHHAT